MFNTTKMNAITELNARWTAIWLFSITMLTANSEPTRRSRVLRRRKHGGNNAWMEATVRHNQRLACWTRTIQWESTQNSAGLGRQAYRRLRLACWTHGSWTHRWRITSSMRNDRCPQSKKRTQTQVRDRTRTGGRLVPRILVGPMRYIPDPLQCVP